MTTGNTERMLEEMEGTRLEEFESAWEEGKRMRECHGSQSWGS